MCVTVSSRFLHILHIASPSCLSILTLIALVRSAWSWAAISNASVSFFSPSVVSQAQLFESAICCVCLRNCPWSGFVIHFSSCSCISLCLSCLLSSPFQSFRMFSLLVAARNSSSLTSIYLLRDCSSMYMDWTLICLLVLFRRAFWRCIDDPRELLDVSCCILSSLRATAYML